MLNQGPRSKFLSGEGGGGLFLAPLFLLNYFLFTLFLFLQNSGGGAQSPPAPPSARSLLTPLKVKEWGV